MTLAAAMTPHPHDLVRVRRPADLLPASAGDRPGWVGDALAAAPWAVVRRDASAAPWIPVGVRGAERGQRWAARAPRAAVDEVVRPWQVPAQARPGRADLPVFVALARVRRVLADRGFGAWGPGGSAAYELVTGVESVRLGSDLDLVLVAERRWSRGRLGSLAERLRTVADVRVDVQVQTPAGGFALDEWLRVGEGGLFALKTDVGPRMVDDAWVLPAPADTSEVSA
jgi:phosphoribosyl-dephospho-CoA transferase